MVLWQPKAWCDRPIALEWAKLVFKKVIDADSAAGVCESEDSYVLPAHPGQPRRAEAARVPRRAQEASNRRPQGAAEPYNTDETQPVDDGVGRAIKIFMGKEETSVWHAV